MEIRFCFLNLELADVRRLKYSKTMQNNGNTGVEGTDDGLSQQINIRISKTMREELERAAKERYSSSSQIARFAVAKELREHRTARDAVDGEVT